MDEETGELRQAVMILALFAIYCDIPVVRLSAIRL